MQITGIAVSNFQCLRHVDLDLSGSALHLFAAHNEQGKSSLAESVRLALIGEPTRVKLKKDLPHLVRDGADKGFVGVNVGINQASYMLPSGKHKALPDTSDYLRFVLDPPSFAALPSQDRRQELSRLTGVKLTEAVLREKLAARKCDQKKVAQLLEIGMGGGFPVAHTWTKDVATQAKGAWKAITGETYGSEKAVGWKAAAPAVDLAALEKAKADIAAADTEISELNRGIGALQAKLRTAQECCDAYAKLEASANNAEHAAELVAITEKDLADYRPQVEAARTKAGGVKKACPELLHEMAALVGAASGWNDDSMLPRASKAIATYEAEYAPGQHDPEAAARLPALESGLLVYERTLKNRKEALAEAMRAKETLATSTKPASPDALRFELESLQSGVKAKQEETHQTRAAIYHMEGEQRTAASAADKTAQAAKHHVDVQQWTHIADALAPDGIPGELLASAIGPLNDRLRTTATITGWPQVALDAAMDIRVDGRPYSLLSESARWRADAALAVAIAQLSGIRMVLLDRVDVLDVLNRQTLVVWLEQIVAKGDLDSALLFGTFKGLPTVHGFESHWIEAGEVVSHSSAVAEAA